MNLSDLTGRQQVKRAMGVDTSTTSLAYCIMEVDADDCWVPIDYGKLDLLGDTIGKRCGDVNRKLYGFLREHDPTAVFIEAPVFINSKLVTIKLSKIVGAATGVVEATGRDSYEVPPMTWMNYIGNPTRDSPAFKKQLRTDNPGKTKSWYKAESRRLRKERTRQWVIDQFDITIDDDDVTDAFGLCWYGIQELL